MNACALLKPLPVMAAMALWTTAAHAASTVDPASFVSGIDNPFFPLQPGTTFVYEGTTDGIPSRDVMAVTHKTKTILGVACTVVHDQAYENGVLVEDTFDYYAQDVDGTVWYFGEDTKELDASGMVVSTEGSWEAGVNDAEPGVIMEANSKVGDKYRQEFSRDVAEDSAKVESLDASACVPYGCFSGMLLTKETTRLEPGVAGEKYYALGVGLVLDVVIKKGQERSELVSISAPGR